MRRQAVMQWIESGGGPLVLVPQTRLDRWCGVDCRSIDDMSDYDRACEVVDDVAVIRVADTEILVLGDEPFRTTWLPNKKGGLLVRWVYADREDSLSELLSDPSISEALSASGVSFMTPGTCLLFDSAEPGDDIRGDSMALALEPGTYAVASAIVNPSAEVRLVIHQLRLIS
jgi:hypothetical protein